MGISLSSSSVPPSVQRDDVDIPQKNPRIVDCLADQIGPQKDLTARDVYLADGDLSEDWSGCDAEEERRHGSEATESGGGRLTDRIRKARSDATRS
jgi:hypothetical protein